MSNLQLWIWLSLWTWAKEFCVYTAFNLSNDAEGSNDSNSLRSLRSWVQQAGWSLAGEFGISLQRCSCASGSQALPFAGNELPTQTSVRSAWGTCQEDWSPGSVLKAPTLVAAMRFLSDSHPRCLKLHIWSFYIHDHITIAFTKHSMDVEYPDNYFREIISFNSHHNTMKYGSENEGGTVNEWNKP